ncbi:MAG: oxygen-dependent coproporphyrinogen oxidase [Bdellovibrionales bacterium]|nr:oxygen-dependent coproporphyrinogen oxidase [Bdellovibrionales bacterium]
MKSEVSLYFQKIQDQISAKLSYVNGQTFREDKWARPGGGGGRTRIFEAGGTFLEKGGVNFSEVHGEFTPEFAKTLPLGDGLEFYATGVSLVLHPTNPFVPTVHMNYRYLRRGNTGWFGGGADLTPVYLFKEDAIHFHQTYSDGLKPFGGQKYAEFKKACDQYFYLPHRNETRGIGGIFFDYQSDTDLQNFALVKACAENFLESYLPIVERRKNLPFAEDHRRFQQLRRGRYVEFNLVYDRGTIFGLKTNGRVESILMSLPPLGRWEYDYQPAAGSPEAEMMAALKPTDWLSGT